MTHEEIEAYGYGNEIIFKNLEEKIMADIVRKIKTAGDLSGSTVYLMEQLSYMGYDIDTIKKMIQEALEESEEYVDKLYDDVLQHEYLGASPIFQAKEVPMIPFKQNPVMQNLLSFAKSSTNGEMKNMTQSLGFVKKTSDGTKAVELTKFYQETMDKALMEVATGTFSLDRALNDAVNTMVNSGVRWIDYESGHHNRIAVAARRSVMSGLANASQEQTKNMAKELDIHTFEVSAHMGARPTHAVWQGKVYTDEELVSVCGLGEVTGLLGANCYHNYYMFFEGVSKRTYTDEELERWKDDTPTKYEGKEYTNYEARQRMRQMETNMRAQKEKIKLLEKGGASKEVIQSAQARYRKQMSEYERFADAMNMKTQKNRITIGDGKTMKGVGFVDNSNKSGTIISGGRIVDIYSEKAQKFAVMYYEEIRHMTTDCERIAKHTGLPISEIQKIKSYLFEDNSYFDDDINVWRRFDPDCAIAQSWQRLLLNDNIRSHDITLLKHEIFEMELKEKYPNIDHMLAHKLASEKYDYPMEADAYYDSLKKHY